ncbi:hypothetical protein IQ265_02720 [Nodosilinea sp. LEGE 06152]|uniref:HpsJ-like protein, cyanoexosortase C-associated n=1 Tax=Nodosilinea sp. LEGE 06152 TaxID=2777966 RepID=UPI0018819525|nr:hypothetical protein [Nodosilinea sp. LEGE 06152]MBE9155748.1 hypothetical protein [Nodosilinea sp. LEGE 06152]
MTSFPQSPLVTPSRSQTPSASTIFLVIGLACVAGFVANLLASAVPLDPMALEWRIGFTQQVSGRGILFFLGLAMLVHSSLERPALARLLALVCLVVGILFTLSGVIVIRDGLVLQNQAVRNIESEATEIRSQLLTAQDNPNLPAEVTPERIEEALVQVETQAQALLENARGQTTKSMMSMLSTQVVVGVGLMALGRFGLKHSL